MLDVVALSTLTFPLELGLRLVRVAFSSINGFAVLGSDKSEEEGREEEGGGPVQPSDSSGLSGDPRRVRVHWTAPSTPYPSLSTLIKVKKNSVVFRSSCSHGKKSNGARWQQSGSKLGARSCSVCILILMRTVL